MDEFGSDEANESRSLVCPHFMACHSVSYDGIDVDAGYTLERVIVHVRPLDAKGFPFRIARLFVFAQLHGAPGDYVLQTRLLRIGVSDGEEVILTRRDFAPRAVEITGDNYVECFAMALTDVRFPEPGVYEFQLWADGFSAPLGRERIQARE